MTKLSSKIFTGILALVLISGYTSTALAQEGLAVAVSTGISDTPIAGPEKGAGPVPTTGQWFEWSFCDATSPAPGCTAFTAFGCQPFSPFICVPSTAGNTLFADAPGYTFTCPAAGCSLSVTDAFNQGDEFDVFDFGGLIGSTSAVFHPTIDIPCAPNGTDPDDCLLDADSSSVVLALPAGAHDISFLPTFVQAEAGAAYFKVFAQPPPPSVGGTMIPIDTTALLLVGAQTTSAWLIPVIVVAIGFAILIARKY